MSIDINITFGGSGGSRAATVADLEAFKEQIMSQLSPKLDALETSVAEVKTRVSALEAKVADEVPTQAELDRIDAVKAEVDGIAVPPEPAPATS